MSTLPPLPDLDYDRRYDDDETFRRVQHRIAQSNYRKSAKGRETQRRWRAARAAVSISPPEEDERLPAYVGDSGWAITDAEVARADW